MNEDVTRNQLYEKSREILDNLRLIPPEIQDKIRWMIEGAKLVVKTERK